MKLLYLIVFLISLLYYVIARTADEDSSEHGVSPGKRSTTCKCGWTNKIGKRIIGGIEADRNEWPMMAGLIERDTGTKKNMHYCGGTVITNWHIITAAHCIHTVKGKPRKENEIGIILGAHNLKEIDFNDPKVMRMPKKLIPHTSYKWPSFHDIAIILIEKIEFSNIIGPACLPIERFDFVDKQMKVIGWGDTDQRGKIPDVLMKTTLNVVEPYECDLYDSFDMNDDYQICTFQENLSGQCVGDSGGPILWNDPETNRYTLMALPSFGFLGCVHTPSVSTDVTYFLPWIKEVVSSTQPEATTCSKL